MSRGTWLTYGPNSPSLSHHQGRANPSSARDIHSPSCGAPVANGCWREMQTFCRQSSVRARSDLYVFDWQRDVVALALESTETD
jgi:hypothetical protein